mmetsp:Transcript_76224/g.241043  ORF Transcript_76224/g.241043 Transcript_76224/m.241043 type:complete len:152 (+) Transcript_76224:96-551(+)
MERSRAAVVALVVVCLASAASASRIRTANASAAWQQLGFEAVAALGARVRAENATAAGRRLSLEVKLGPFVSAAEACDYCFASFTKEGVPPAGPVAPACVCMAYPEVGGGDFNMFCATPTAAAKYIAGKGGCRCKARDMEHMAATTCEPIS